MKDQSLRAGSAGDRLEEAADWFFTLQERDVAELSADELQRWERWSGNADNLAAFDRLAQRWQAMDTVAKPQLPTERELRADSYDGAMPVSQWRSARAFRPTAIQVTALAATIGALALGVAFWLDDERPQPQIQQAQSTGRAEHRELPLPDGSRITLGARSALSVQFSGNQRTVTLDRGEALFTIARDPSRPFVVRAGQSTVTALGTAFNLQRDADHLSVTVTEGVVEVASTDTATPQRLRRGEAVRITTAGTAEPVQNKDPELATAWRDGRLRYRAEPLSDVIADVNRYSERQVEVDPAVATLEFTGTVFTDQTEEWMRALPRIFPVEVVERDATHVIVRPKPTVP